MKKKVTSVDVAKASGVSQATVSMVLNKKYNVSFSKETVEKVEKAANDMGYTAPHRRIRKENKTRRLILVFCPTLTNPYYVMLLQGIEEVAKDEGYAVFVCNTQRDLKMEEHYLKMVAAVQPLGIIYSCNPSSCFMKEIKALAQKIPFVVINNREDIMEVDAVELNNSKPGRLMARHLLELGHQNAAFVSPPLTDRQRQRFKRVEGFVKEFEAAGFKDSVYVKSADEDMDRVIPSVDSEYKTGYHLTRELIREHPELTAIAGLNDMIAYGIMDALNDEKRRVPADVSVIGCDNILFSKMKRMSLTTIEHFVPLKGRDACEIIIRKITSQNSTQFLDLQPASIYHVEYEPKLIVRGTTSYARKTKSLIK